jgi:MFS family permease
MTDAVQARRAAEVAANFRWNFTVNALDISFYMLAMNMISQSTILPLLVARLTDSKVAIGLLPAIIAMGFLLPQLFTASHTETLKRKKPFIVLWSGLGERLPYLAIGLIVLYLAEPAPLVTLIAFYLLLLLATGAGGALAPAWYDMIAKVIPLERRGVWSGVGFGLGALMGVAGAALAGRFLSDLPYPQSFAACFLAAFAFQAVSWSFLALNREPESDTVKPQASMRDYFRRLPAILRADRNYQVYLITRSVISLSGMAAGFYIVFGSERFGLTGAQVGWLTAVLVGTQALLNLLLGMLGDRRGHKLVLVLGAFTAAAASLAALLASSFAGLLLVFLLLGAAIAAETVSSFNIIIEFCRPEDRPTYIGLTNTLLAPVRILAPILGGVLVAQFDYQVLFGASLAAGVAGALAMARWLREPRHQALAAIAQPPASPTPPGG